MIELTTVVALYYYKLHVSHNKIDFGRSLEIMHFVKKYNKYSSQ